MARARSKLSTLSMRSEAKREMAKERALSMSRLVRSCRLRKSAIERRYLSYGSRGSVCELRMWMLGGGLLSR